MISLRSRYQGAMLGVLCGDALGAPYETWNEERILDDVFERDGLRLFDYDDPWGKDGRFPAGRPTDDSELTAALAEHLVHGVCPEDLYRRFRSCVIDRKSLLCDLPAYGFGGTTRRALAAATYEEACNATPTKAPIPSNGSLMRTVPVALRYHGMEKTLDVAARKAARITHRHEQAIDATVAYVFVLDALLTGRPYTMAVQHALPRIARTISDKEVWAVFFEQVGKPLPPEKFGGSAVHTLRVAHYALITSYTFEEGITKAVTIGGDTDTYGAVAGGLLGAEYGVDAIPSWWRDGLLGGARMEELGLQLFDKRSGP